MQIDEIPQNGTPSSPRGVRNAMVPHMAGRSRGTPLQNHPHQPPMDAETVVLVGQAALATQNAQAGEYIAHLQGDAAVRTTRVEADAALQVTTAQANAALETLRATAEVHVANASQAAGAQAARTEVEAVKRVVHAEGELRKAQLEGDARVFRAETDASLQLAEEGRRNAERIANLEAGLRLEQERQQLNAQMQKRVQESELAAQVARIDAAHARQQQPAAAPASYDPHSRRAALEAQVQELELERRIASLQARGNEPGLRGEGLGQEPPTGRTGYGGSPSYVRTGVGALNVPEWFGASASDLAMVHLQQERLYEGVLASGRAQAREAKHLLRLLGLLTGGIPHLQTLDDAEDLLAEIGKATVGRLEVLREGTVTGSWESAQRMEEALFVTPQLPSFLSAAMQQAEKARRPSNSSSSSNNNNNNKSNNSSNSNSNSNNNSSSSNKPSQRRK